MNKILFILLFILSAVIAHAQLIDPNGLIAAGGNGIGGAPKQLAQPIGVFVTAGGTLYVSDYQNSRIQMFPPYSDSTTAGITVGGGSFGSGPNQLNGPCGLVVDKNGNVFVADYFNNRVQEFLAGSAEDSNAITVAGNDTAGSAANELDMPQFIFVDNNGNLYVSDRNNDRVQKFPPGSTSATNGVTVAGGNGQGAAANQLYYPAGIFVDTGGNLFVADLGNNRIQKFPPGSTSATNATTVAGNDTAPGYLPYELNMPTGVYVDDSGYIYVTDLGNNRVQEFPINSGPDSSAYTLAGFDTATTLVTQLNMPAGIWLDRFHNVFVADQGNNRIMEYQDSSWLTGINNVPDNISLYVAPNPFEGSTTLVVNLPLDQSVAIQVFNVLGQEMETSVAKFYRGKNMVTVGKNLATGNYFLKFTTGTYTKTIKILAIDK